MIKWSFLQESRLAEYPNINVIHSINKLFEKNLM